MDPISKNLANNLDYDQYLNLNLEHGVITRGEICNGILGYLTLGLGILFIRPRIFVYGKKTFENEESFKEIKEEYFGILKVNNCLK